MIFGKHTTITYHLENNLNDDEIIKIIADEETISLPIEKHYKTIHVYLGEKHGI